MKNLAKVVTVGILMTATLLAQERQFKAEHMRPWRNHRGTLRIHEKGIEFKWDDGRHRHSWNFAEIQQLKIAPHRLEVLTYEDQKWRLGKDRVFQFKVLENDVDAELSEFLRQKITGVFVTALLLEISVPPAYRMSVKHLGILEGSSGVLEVYNDRILYRSEAKPESRFWTYQQIESFAISSKREFELMTDEKKFGGPTRTFRFQSHEPIPESLYDYFWVRLYGSSYYPVEKPSRGRHAAELK